MELVPPATPAKKFLGIQMTPAAGCFGTFLSLQNGIIMIAMIDILAGLVQVLLKLFVAYASLLIFGDLGQIPADISACAPLFGVLAIFGIRDLDSEKLNFYSYYKQIEFVVRAVNLIIIGLTLTPIIFVAFIVYCGFSGYCAFIAWSAYELVKSDEGMLVKHGPGSSTHPSQPSF